MLPLFILLSIRYERTATGLAADIRHPAKKRQLSTFGKKGKNLQFHCKKNTHRTTKGVPMCILKKTIKKQQTACLLPLSELILISLI